MYSSRKQLVSVRTVLLESFGEPVFVRGLPYVFLLAAGGGFLFFLSRFALSRGHAHPTARARTVLAVLFCVLATSLFLALFAAGVYAGNGAKFAHIHEHAPGPLFVLSDPAKVYLGAVLLLGAAVLLTDVVSVVWGGGTGGGDTNGAVTQGTVQPEANDDTPHRVVSTLYLFTATTMLLIVFVRCLVDENREIVSP
jgi:hypothetical protein